MTSLRASGVELHVRVAEEFPAVARLLQDASNATASQQQNVRGTGNLWYDHELFMTFMTGSVALIVLCNLVCLWYRVRRWCKPDATEGQAPPSVDVSGRVFDLTPGQRRAVLEAIFSETSKEVTEKAEIVSRKEKRKQRKSSTRTNVHVTICGLDSVNDHVIAERESDHDLEEGVVGAQVSEVSPVPAVCDPIPLETVSSSSALVQNDDENTDGQLPSSNRLSALEKMSVAKREAVKALTRSTQKALSTETTTDVIVVSRASLPCGSGQDDEHGDHSPIFRRFPTDLAVPDLRENNVVPPPAFIAGVASVEESIEDEEDGKLPAKPITFSAAESIGSSHASESDDETDENVCPICLNSYDEGDVLIASKHCSHLFHKCCILEWLQKHDSCPVCRVDMITEGELNQAATTIVGRTRMYVAVESIACNSGQGARDAGARRHVLPAHRHVIAAPLTPPPSPPSHRNSRLICVTVNVPQLAAAQGESRAARGRISFY